VDAFGFRFIDLEKVAEVEQLVERLMESRTRVWEVERAHQRRHRSPVKSPRNVELVRMEQPAVVQRGPAPPPRHRIAPPTTRAQRQPTLRDKFDTISDRLRAIRERLPK
jgi:hypothetical protein